MEGGWLGRGGKGRGAIGGGVGKGEWSILSQGVPTHSYATRPTRRRRRGGWLRALSRGAEWRVGEAFVCVCGGGGGGGGGGITLASLVSLLVFPRRQFVLIIISVDFVINYYP